MSIRTSGVEACELAMDQGFRGQWRHNSRSDNWRVGDSLSYCNPDDCYRVHPDDVAAFIARNSPAVPAPVVVAPVVSAARPHAELIKAWADGAEIEGLDESTQLWYFTQNPSWKGGATYRIKPQVVAPRVTAAMVNKGLERMHYRLELRKQRIRRQQAALEKELMLLQQHYKLSSSAV